MDEGKKTTYGLMIGIGILTCMELVLAIIIIAIIYALLQFIIAIGKDENKDKKDEKKSNNVEWKP